MLRACGVNAVLATLGLVMLSGCAPRPPQPVAAAPPPGHTNFSLDTPLHRIAADPRGKAILVRDMPGLMASHSYILFDDMSIAQIAQLSHGRLTTEKLNLVEADLVALNNAPPLTP